MSSLGTDLVIDHTSKSVFLSAVGLNMTISQTNGNVGYSAYTWRVAL